MAGIFITLEGGEGSGKSTLARGLRARLEASGLDCVLTREPGGSPGAEAIRTLALSPREGDEWTGKTQALLMNAARADHVARLIAPALEAGKVVICDRFTDSTLAYQGLGDPVLTDTLRLLAGFSTDGLNPDLTLLLDGPVEAFAARRAGRAGVADVYERKDLGFHQTIRDVSLTLAAQEPRRIVVIDGTQAPESVLDSAWQAVLQRTRIGEGLKA